MGRVVKKSGKVFIVTHGKPESRTYVFGRGLPYSDFSFSFCRQSANLIF